MPESKYFKPKSIAWWSGIVTLITGLFVAAVDVHGLTSFVSVINNVTGGLEASIMITYALSVIGLRGKDG